MAAEFSGAMPRLYGAPAYTRPPRPAVDTQRPFDPDDMPLECYRSAAPEPFAADAAIPAESQDAAGGEDWLARATRAPFRSSRR